jgi:hypothetical protein
MSFNPSSTKLAIGFGISALLLYGLVHAAPGGLVRYVNIDGTTLRVRRMKHGTETLFEVAGWGVGVLFTDEPSGPPIGLFTFNQAGPISVSGNPGLTDFIRQNLGRMPEDLLTREECAKPGCSL